MTPIAHFSRRYRLSASHRLFLPQQSQDENAAMFGKCANPFGHGHNYWIEVTVGGPIDAMTGMVVDMVALDAVVKRNVLDRWDHTNLNEDPHFKTVVPSTENFAFEVERVLRSGIESLAAGGRLRLVQIRIEETPNNSFELAAQYPVKTGC